MTQGTLYDTENTTKFYTCLHVFLCSYAHVHDVCMCIIILEPIVVLAIYHTAMYPKTITGLG